MAERFDHRSAWAWVGVAFSIALNILAGWVVVQEMQKPELPVIEACAPARPLK